jgi:hypothetical protein
MHYEYTLSFNHPQISELELFDCLNNSLQLYGISNKLRESAPLTIKAIYQANTFELSYERHKNFPQVIHIQTTERQNLDNDTGIVRCIWRLIHEHLNIDYTHMEVLEKKVFDIVNARFEKRFISPYKLHVLLASKFTPLNIIFSTQKNNDYEIINATIPLDTVRTLEVAWISFASKLNYDDWDIINKPFIPITLEEYKTEISTYTVHWEIPKSAVIPQETSPITSILNLENTWNFKEYLILREDTINYLSLYIPTP